MSIAFVHHVRTANIGDLACGPYRYFDFPDQQIYDLHDRIPPCDAVIFGGGAIEPKLRTHRLHDAVEARTKIAWGIGTSRRRKRRHGPLVDDLDLCGVREFGRQKSVANAFYVPCVTCMSSLFDRPYDIAHKVVFYRHGGFEPPGSEAAEIMRNDASTLEEAIRFIASGEIVVTNSFHGAYWGLLLGRKVVCVPFSSKFYGFKFPPSYCLDGDWAAAAEKAIAHPEALADARRHNIAFYERVQNLLQSNHGPPMPKMPKPLVETRKPAALPNPYAAIEPRAHWKRAVSGRAPTAIEGWYRKKFEIGAMRIATAGSCFAQHIGRRLRNSGFAFVDTEPAPAVMLPAARAEYGYGLYSARYGNIYTTRQLRQLIERAEGTFKPAERIWRKGDGVVDPFRPTVEPHPYETVADLKAARGHHMKRVARLLRSIDLFVFTLGLTETWVSVRDGAAFPVAPGVAGGAYSPARHRFLNLTYEDVVADLQWTIDTLRRINPKMHFLFTVSPVPLMATATADHVVVATSHSKAILRAAAGHFAAAHDFVDYFPSFEIINAHVMQGRFYEPSNQRDVVPDGVDHVMSVFFSEHAPPPERPDRPRRSADEVEQTVCDEELLASFGGAS